MSDASAEGFDNTQLVSYRDRLVRLHEERKALADDIADVLQEAASNGFDKAALKTVVRISMEDPAKRDKRAQVDDALSVYLSALGLS